MAIYAQPTPKSLLPNPEVMHPMSFILCHQYQDTAKHPLPCTALQTSFAKRVHSSPPGLLTVASQILFCSFIFVGIARTPKVIWICRKSHSVQFLSFGIKDHGFLFLQKEIKATFRIMTLQGLESALPTTSNSPRALKRPLNVSQGLGPKEQDPLRTRSSDTAQLRI